MPTWGEILTELKQTEEKGVKPPFDTVRRKYLAATYEKTGRNTILYATKWTRAGGTDPELLSITEEDIQGLMEVIHGLKGPNLDLIVHIIVPEVLLKQLKRLFHTLEQSSLIFV